MSRFNSTLNQFAARQDAACLRAIADRMLDAGLRARSERARRLLSERALAVQLRANAIDAWAYGQWQAALGLEQQSMLWANRT